MDTENCKFTSFSFCWFFFQLVFFLFKIHDCFPYKIKEETAQKLQRKTIKRYNDQQPGIYSSKQIIIDDQLTKQPICLLHSLHILTFEYN